jgi:NAD(P)H-dependent flavin oxidoreductase YrpB (nitropropane dioxygenase family)
MFETDFTRLLGIQHPLVCAGMGAGTADGELAGRVSEAGALGVIGASWLGTDEIDALVYRAREITSNPIGINLLLFGNDDLLPVVLKAKPAVLSTAWARDDQDLGSIFAQAHDSGAKVMHMVPNLKDAERAAEAGADVIVAQGTEGGGHVGLMAATVIVRQVVKAVAPVPVLAAGGFADGAGLAAALALGAQGVLMGTRFLATQECPVPQFFKDAIVASDGTDTVLTTVPDTLTGRDWPGAWSRVARNAFVEDWTGQEPELRRHRSKVWARLEQAWEEDQPDYWNFWWGQSAGLVESVLPADELVRQIMTEAENSLRILSSRLVTPG